MDFFTLIGGIVVLILVLRLRKRVKKLEQLAVSIGIPNISKQQDQESDPSSIIQPQHIKLSWFGRFIGWLKEDWLLKLGALVFLFGSGLITSGVLLVGVGPAGRITFGVVVGTLFLAFGWWRIKKYLHQGEVFLVLGSTIILLMIFAARELYDFFNPSFALTVMFLSIAFVALASVKYNSSALSLSSFILAGIAPLFTNIPEPNHIGLFAYLLIVVLGTVWIVVLTGRRELTTVALLLIVFYSIPLFGSAEVEILLLFEYAFASIFFIMNIVGILRSKNNKLLLSLITAAGNGLLLLIWIMFAAQDEWKSLIIIVWMMVFMVSAFLVTKITQKTAPFYIYIGIGAMLLAAATSVELEGKTLIMAYTIESGILSLITYYIICKTQLAERLSLLLIFPIFLSFESMTSLAWRTNFLHEDFFVLFVLTLILFGLGLFFWSKNKQIENKKISLINLILLVTGSLYFYILLWLSLHAEFQGNNIAATIFLVICTSIGLIIYIKNQTSQNKKLQIYGGLLLGGVVARLLVVDIWRGALFAFFFIGIALLAVALLDRKKRKLTQLDIKNPDLNNQ